MPAEGRAEPLYDPGASWCGREVCANHRPDREATADGELGRVTSAAGACAGGGTRRKPHDRAPGVAVARVARPAPALIGRNGGTSSEGQGRARPRGVQRAVGAARTAGRCCGCAGAFGARSGRRCRDRVCAFADGEPFAVERSSFSGGPLSGLLGCDLTGSLYELLGDATPCARSSESNGARRREDAAALGLRAGAPQMVVDRSGTTMRRDRRDGAGRLSRRPHAHRRLDVGARARVSTVVIGGGIAGVSCAYHLAKAGVKGVVLVEKGGLTSGSTHHAAGLVTQFNPSPTMMRFRRYSVELYKELGVFETVGSLRIASSAESWLELLRGVSRAHGIGLEAELVGSGRRFSGSCLPRHPTALYGAVWMPGDGYVDPHIATYALASAARGLGAEIRTHTLVTGIEDARRGGQLSRSKTEDGRDRGERRSSMRRGCGRRGSQRWSARSRARSRRSPAHRVPCRRGARALSRDAVFPRHRQPRLREGRERGRPLRRLRAEPGLTLGGRRAVGAQRDDAAGRPRALRAADGRRGAAVPVPRRGGRDGARVPSRRDDARRQPAARAGAGCARLLARGRAVAKRLRRRGRARQGARGARDRGRR